MTITLNGTTGITTPDVTSSGSLNINASAPDDSLVVDASGNVGVGVTPSEKLSVNGRVYVTGSGYISNPVGMVLGQYSSSDVYIQKPAGSKLSFWDNATNAQMTLDSSGNLLVGTTTSRGRLTVESASGACRAVNVLTGTGTIDAFTFNGGTTIGSITTNGVTVSYNTSSDYRLKEDWQPMTEASERVKALKPVNFAWKADGSRVDGFLAHEAAEVVPEAVTGEKDAVELVDIKDEDGNVTGQEERPVYQGIDQSKLVPLLTAALQEALAKIDDLTARVSALEATNV